MTCKDLTKLIEDDWSKFKVSITESSKSDQGVSLVESGLEIYNFDEICKQVFPKNTPTSADGIHLNDDYIQLIEFKSGFKQKITKSTFDPKRGTCPETQKICSDYWNLFWENQDRKKDELINSIKLKGLESYLVLEKQFFPRCEDLKNSKKLKLLYTVVIDEDGIDGIEDTLYELSLNDQIDTDNSLVSVRKSLKRLVSQKDCDGNIYLYDMVEVLSAREFKNRLHIYKSTI